MIADAHVDLLMELAYRERRLGESGVFATTWLPLLERGGVGLQVCPIYVDVSVQPEGALREALSLAASFHRAIRENADRVVQVSAAGDLAPVEAGERIGLLLSLEGGVFDTPRNLEDEQLRALAEAGGLFGLMLHPIAIGPERRTLDGVVDHLEHAVSVMGLERVCLGGDFTRRLWEAMPPPPVKDPLAPPGLTPGLGIEGLTGPEQYPALVERLGVRGWGDEEVAAVTGGNLLRFLRASLRASSARLA